MDIKAVSFDIGHTLVKYNNPLNWSALYEPALARVAQKLCVDFSDMQIKRACEILTRYNTRVNPRENEINSQTVFVNIFNALALPYKKLEAAKEAFYGFFQADTVCYDDAKSTLLALKQKGVLLGFLTDVAYGMDNQYSLCDIKEIIRLFDAGFTSVDVGFRKPNAAGFIKLLDAFHLSPSQMMYVGDEQKDIIGASAMGIVSVLIDRDGKKPDWGQDYTVGSLREILELEPFLKSEWDEKFYIKPLHRE